MAEEVQELAKEHDQQPSPDVSTARLLFSVIQKEYDYEIDRGKNLETRTGIFLTFTGAALVFLISNVKLSSFLAVQIKNVLQALPYAFLLILLVLILISFIGSVIFFIKVLSIKTYKRIALDCFEGEKLGKNILVPEAIATIALIPIYKTCIDSYSEVNDKRVKWFKYGIRLILLALIFTSITFLLKLFTF